MVWASIAGTGVQPKTSMIFLALGGAEELSAQCSDWKDLLSATGGCNGQVFRDQSIYFSVSPLCQTQ